MTFFVFLCTLTLLLLVTYTTNEPFPCNSPPTPPITNSCLHTAAIPERFQGIIALTNHPLGSGAHEIDVPSFQNNGGALWGASWCHNFSCWQAWQVYFGPKDGQRANENVVSTLINRCIEWGGESVVHKQPADMLNFIPPRRENQQLIPGKPGVFISKGWS